MTINLSPTLQLPDELATDTNAFLGLRGSGKSNGAVRLVEELWRIGQQLVVLDPKGDWWGIRSSADGKGPGLSIPIFGGLHGDLPLPAESGALMARLVIEENLSCLLDLSDFASKAQQIRFATEFAEELFRLIRRSPRALHMVIEEAEEFLPQKTRDGKEPAMVGIYSKLSKQGRNFGIGITLVTQRSASISKDALAMTNNLFAHATRLPADKTTIAAWVDDDYAKEVKASLSTLQPGECWLVGAAIPVPLRFMWDRRHTFDSGATPKVGERLVEPKQLADIDLTSIEVLMKETVEKVRAEDPKLLHARIRTLETEARDAHAVEADLRAQLAAAPAVEPERVEVPIVTEELLDTVQDAWGIVSELQGSVKDAVAEVQKLSDLIIEKRAAAVAVPAPTQTVAPRTVMHIRATPLDETGLPTGGPPIEFDATDPDALPITGLAKSILSVLAQYPDGMPLQKLGLLTKKAPKGGYFARVMGQLRSAGLVEKGQPIRITQTGLAAIEGQWEPIPTGPEALAYWADDFFSGLGGKILRVIADGQAHEKDEMECAVGAAPNGGYFARVLGQLRTAGLVSKGWPLQGTDDFLDAIA